MSNILVVKNGHICEEVTGEEGLYPQLGILNGTLIAGNVLLAPLKVIGGAIVQQVFSPGGVLWDIIPTSVWDSGTSAWGTDWDVVAEAIWDSGTTTWS